MPAAKTANALSRCGTDASESIDALFAVSYSRLQKIASAMFRTEPAASLLEPCGMVNELYLKLAQQRRLQFQDRAHFFRYCAQAMRHMLVDHARAANALRRDVRVSVPLSEALAVEDESDDLDLLDIHRALVELRAFAPRLSALIELRFLQGASTEEAAAALKVSKATVSRDLSSSMVWLRDRLTSRSTRLN